MSWVVIMSQQNSAARCMISAGVSALLLILTACSGSPAASPSPRVPENDNAYGPPATQAAPAPHRTTGPGDYNFKARGGGLGTLHVPGAPVAGIEELRTFVNAPPVTYITGTVDNRQGSETIRVVAMSIFTPEGKEVKYKEAFDYVGELLDKVPDSTPLQQRNKFHDLLTSYLDPIPPLAVKDVVLVGPEVPAQITGITVAPNGTFSPVPAQAAE